MAGRGSRIQRDARLAFEAITIEGGLLAADWLTRIAQLSAGAQSAEDYDVLKGLELRDEIGRFWRVAQAHWSELQAGRKAKAAPEALSRRFILALFKDVLGFGTLTDPQGIPATPGGQPSILGDGQAQVAPSVTLDGRQFPLSYFALGKRVPVVVVPVATVLNTTVLDAPRRDLGEGVRKRSAFGLIQEFVNASSDALWGICSDGLKLRLTRDNASLTRPAWIEVDLARIFNEALLPDFAVVWLLLHASRFGRPDQLPDKCPLETWRAAGREEGTRARDRLRAGFEDALVVLGQGFLSHPANYGLRQALHSGNLKKEAYFGQLLRLVYRVIFLLTVEERALLHPGDATREARDRYRDGYAFRRLRERATRHSAHDRHSDLWEGVKIVFQGLATGQSLLGLPTLAGIFSTSQCPDLDGARLENRTLLQAVFRLSWLKEGGGLSRVNWRDMGPDELGYVYEGLLELVPQVTEDGRTFTFAGRDESRGNARKTSGSYYTPDSLVQLLLDSALEPVIQHALAANPEKPAEALLKLTIVDPACGSGHFLLAAARRLAEHIARLQSEGTPSPEEYRHALRQVVGRCIFGVDLNPLAVELCKVALWMEAVDPGLPLGFLDAHIRHGNALLGTSRALMGNGIPDEAWVALEGDDKKVTASLKKRNKGELTGQGLLPMGIREPRIKLNEVVKVLEATPDTDPAGLAEKERLWANLNQSEGYRHEKGVYDAWCAAFVWPKSEAGPVSEAAPTTGVWRAIRDGERVPSPLLSEITAKLAGDYHLFHWELAFPQVFETGGFDVVLGNPPWERVKLQEQEFFAARDDRIANAPSATERKRLIAELPIFNPELWDHWCRQTRVAQGNSHFARESGRYPLCGRGDVNTYALFAEHNGAILSLTARAGFIVPSGIVTDDTTKDYFRDLTEKRRLSTVYHFENEDNLFKGLHHAYRFVLITIGEADKADMMFYARSVQDLEAPERHFALSPDDFILLNPNTRTCPTFRSRRDADINLTLYGRAGVLWREEDPDGNPWGLRFLRMLDMANDSGLFRTRDELEAAGWKLTGNQFEREGQRLLPLIEAKMVHHYDHRFSTYEGQSNAQRNMGKAPELDETGHQDPTRVTLPDYWVAEDAVEERLSEKWSRGWLLGWRDICRSTDKRTVIASLIPRAATGDTLLLAFPLSEPKLVAALYANLCTLGLDYAARQKVGGTHLKYHTFKQLPVLAPQRYAALAPWTSEQSVRDWLLPRVLELTYTAWDLQPFAEDCGDHGPPFRWDSERRVMLKAELDAAFFHLYGVMRDDADYILSTFGVVERIEMKSYGEFRTRRLILERYDALAQAASTGPPYISPLPEPRRTE